MRLAQLHAYLGQLLEEGVDPHTVVCAPLDGEFGELSNAHLVAGPFREDPAPLCPAPLNSTGPVLVLATVLDGATDLLRRKVGSSKERATGVDDATCIFC